MCLSCTASKTLLLIFQNLKRSHDPEDIPFGVTYHACTSTVVLICINQHMKYDGMQYDPIQGQGQGHKPNKVGNSSIFKRYLLRLLQWELATDHRFLNQGTISKFDRTRFLIFVLLFDFELGRNVSCEEWTVSPIRGYFIVVYLQSL